MRAGCVLRLGGRTLYPTTLTHYALRIGSLELPTSRRLPPLATNGEAVEDAGGEEGVAEELAADHGEDQHTDDVGRQRDEKQLGGVTHVVDGPEVDEAGYRRGHAGQGKGQPIVALPAGEHENHF